MTSEEFSAPAPLADPDAPIVDRNGVRRSKDGRPYIKERCPDDQSDYDGPCVGGRVPGARKGTTKKCPTCKGTGYKERLYTRCTTFVGALEDRQNLEAWQKRIVLLGLKASPMLYDRLGAIEVDDRDALDELAEHAYEAGDGYRAAQKGTDLHALTELVDTGEPLPPGVTLADRRDMAAWCRVFADHGLRVLSMETFVVEDEYGIAGTYDRRVEASASSEAYCTCGRPMILDLKTGRIDYGGGKIAQQLAVYAHGQGYDPETGKRHEVLTCPHRGLIVHLPQGTGTATLHVVDLVAGWKAVGLSAAVREHRRRSKTWLTPVASPLVLVP